MVELNVAGVLIDDALTEIKDYDEEHPDTIVEYDRAFAATRVPSELGPDVIRATRHLASRISNDAGNWLIETGKIAPWADVPSDALLVNEEPAQLDGLNGTMGKLWNHFWKAPGRKAVRVSTGKLSKVLHLMRPHLFPILDSQVRKTYRQTASEVAQELGIPGPDGKPYRFLFWAAIRRDVITNAEALKRLREELVGAARDDYSPRLAMYAELSDVRLLDICAWRIGKNLAKG